MVLVWLAGMFTASAQDYFPYTLQLEPVAFPGLGGLHSYAFAQHEGKWLVVGGRLDGLHARQPFNAFPAASNNTELRVIDPSSKQVWTASVLGLPAPLREQLQATNMNFFQDGNTLYIIGGYAYSASEDDHITFPYLTSVQVPELIDAIINGTPITPMFKQTYDLIFAVTGGQLGKIDDTFLLVGGHRFDGRYNPMNNPTFTQAYTNQVRLFQIDNSGNQLSFYNYSSITDPLHLHRRDYNLLPQVFPDGSHGYTISSGVFQLNADLPFLYPVDIRLDGITPHTNFNQFLSNYHCAKVSLFDSLSHQTHSLFFGGMSQYYYQDGALFQDNLVPFVKTISRLSRYADGSFQEFQLPIEMPGLQGASAEFIPNLALPHYPSELIKLHEIQADTILLGHVYGGIYSPSPNPFSFNQTNTTSADNSLYAVYLIRDETVNVQQLDGRTPYEVQVFPNPATNQVQLRFDLPEERISIDYFLTDSQGRVLQTGPITQLQAGPNTLSLSLQGYPSVQVFFVTLVFDNTYYVTRKVLRVE
jgi:hypothetical protein